MADAVFLDTNVIRNKDAKRFFGNTEKLRQISRVTQLFIPSIVIDEIKWQKRETLFGALNAFKENYFFKQIRCNEQWLKSQIDLKIAALYEEAINEISFNVAQLKEDESHISKLSQLAIQKRAPFKKGSDAGFKDSCIYLTILQHLDETEDHVFLVSADGRLIEAFDNIPRVETITEPSEYFDLRSSYFKEEYFLRQLEEDFKDPDGQNRNITFNTDNIQSAELDEEDNWIVKISLGPENWNVIVDYFSREVLEIKPL